MAFLETVVEIFLWTFLVTLLENRSNQLKIKNNNKNDVIKLIGNPHTKSIDKNDWIYIERVLTKGSYFKFGQNVIKTNNVLVLSEKITENDLAKKSFVQSFLSSIKQKMYGNR